MLTSAIESEATVFPFQHHLPRDAVSSIADIKAVVGPRQPDCRGVDSLAQDYSAKIRFLVT